MNIRPILVYFILFLSSYSASAQFDEVCGIMGPQDSTAWGIGLIAPQRDVYLKGLDARKKSFLFGNGRITDAQGTKVDAATNDFIRLGSYAGFLKVYEIKNTAYLVLLNSIEGGLWIDANELHSNRLTFSTYYQMLFNDHPDSREYWRSAVGSLGVNLTNSCLNVRTDASTESKIVKCFTRNKEYGKFHSIIFRNHEGPWAFISVFEYVSIPDTGEYGEGCAFKLANECRGWAKVIDDNGFPNIWYATTKY